MTKQVAAKYTSAQNLNAWNVAVVSDGCGIWRAARRGDCGGGAAFAKVELDRPQRASVESGFAEDGAGDGDFAILPCLDAQGVANLAD